MFCRHELHIPILLHLVNESHFQQPSSCGNNASDDDPLLKFKKKFAAELSPLMLGRLVHQPQAFEELVAATVAARPELEAVRFFLKYRL